MDERTQQAVDTTLANELMRNERVVLHPKFGSVKLSRPTPEQEAQIADVRRKRYHTDLFDDADPKRSKDELRERAIAKGMWREEYEEQIQDLTRHMGEAMGILDAIGFRSLDSLIAKYQTSVQALLDLYPDNEEIQGVIRTYANLDLEPQSGDRTRIMDEAPTTKVDDLLEDTDTFRSQIDLLQELGKTRTELEKLRSREIRLFVDSLEARAEREEELARVYHCATSVETGKPLWPSLDAMRKAPAEDVAFLVLEMAYFVNGVTEEFKEVLGRFGFTQRLIGTSDSSDDSHDQPESSLAGDSPESEVSPSSEPTESATPRSTV